jgi:2-oxoglutarate ferredoxin oxidoreductase subunit alpha
VNGPAHTGWQVKLRNGNQMVAEGAAASGCRFFAGYPITPASGIYKGMIEILQRRGDLAISAPDEISALAYCVGAATSGPGWALMIETLQYALMTETPLVIALVQRLGPSTGGATQGAQGDVLLTEYCTSGGYTIPVFTPSTAAECFELTVHAFSWSEILRTPVVLLLDKEVAMTTETVDYSTLATPPVANRVMHAGTGGGNGGGPGKFDGGTPRMYDFTEISDVPPFIPVGGGLKVTATGSAHNKSGELKKNDPETLEMLKHLEEKILFRAGEMETIHADTQEGADTLVLSYGITARAAREAVRMARDAGRAASFLNLKTLFPVPEASLRSAAAGAGRVIIAEENMHGQYRGVIRHLFGGADVRGVNKVGSMITPDEILGAMS